jgi:putative FmdB family regulatory protein
MPVYEYTCSHCGRKKIDIRAISARDKKTKCDKCGGKMKRKVSVTGRPVVK